MTSTAPVATEVTLVLVSHSAAVAEGVADLVREIAGSALRIFAVGGSPGGSIGTDSARIAEVLRENAGTTGDVVVVMDFGSSVLTVRAVLAEMTPAQRARVIAVDAPLVEGALAAGMTASRGGSAPEAARAAEEARHVPKL